MSQSGICIVCSCETDKYKCPTCLSKYCSLNCFKKHKEGTCTPAESTSSAILPNEELSKAIDNYLFPTEDTVSREKLKLLDNDESLKNLLRNHHLRNLLLSINNSDKPVRAISEAMMIPLFVEFSDACLKVVEPEPIQGVEAEN